MSVKVSNKRQEITKAGSLFNKRWKPEAEALKNIALMYFCCYYFIVVIILSTVFSFLLSF